MMGRAEVERRLIRDHESEILDKMERDLRPAPTPILDAVGFLRPVWDIHLGVPHLSFCANNANARSTLPSLEIAQCCAHLPETHKNRFSAVFGPPSILPFAFS